MLFGRGIRRIHAWTLLVVAVLVALAACTSHIAHSPVIKSSLVQKDYERALARIEKINKNTSRLLYLYEKALVLHYRGDYAASSAALEEAELIYEDLYTKSISRQLGSLITTDNIIQYRGQRYEIALIHYYNIFNYLYRNQPEGALVECRKLNQLLQRFADSKGEVYTNDSFLQYLTGLVYYAFGEYSDALVSFRLALEVFQQSGEGRGAELPAHFWCDLTRGARAAYDFETAELYEEAATDCAGPREGDGVLNLFLEVGYVPHKIERSLVLPLYKDEITDNMDQKEYAKKVHARRDQPRDYKRKLAYVLKVSVPYMVSNPFPYPDIRTRVVVDGQAQTRDATVVENLEVCAFEAFREDEPAMILKTIARGIAKYLAKKGVEKKEGELAGWLVNVFNVATETADTRSWSTLPQSIRMSRFILPAGTYDIEVILLDPLGGHDQSFTIPGVEISSGQTKFLNYRIF